MLNHAQYRQTALKMNRSASSSGKTSTMQLLGLFILNTLFKATLDL